MEGNCHVLQHLFSSKLQETGGVTLKPLCSTRWTARTATTEAILTDYTFLLETLEEVHSTTHDEYGLKIKAGGLTHLLEKFSTLFGLQLSHIFFSTAEQVSFTVQRKDIALDDALSAVDAAEQFFKRTRCDENFTDKFYDKTVADADKHNIGHPELPRYRRCPK